MSRESDSSSPASRRDFLKTGTAALAGTALAGSLAHSVHAGEDHTLKVALIGCGGRGTGAALQALSTAGPVKLWAMADAFEDRLQASLEGLQKGVAARYDREASKGLGERVDVPKERRFVGLDAYRNAIDSGVDVVVIAAPPGFRPQHFEYAVNAGKHVFMEKPLATDPPGVRRVLAAAEAARKKNLKVGVGLQRHHQASYQEAIRRIHDGELGEILALRC
ncbi:MAG TPA: Gfo/Idh/MocA family oxidoreductase, partial [Pirellulales bacterium]|nr:Gfo/Idh/MocA family oxidoreductase [Pirellulales bacterium]